MLTHHNTNYGSRKPSWVFPAGKQGWQIDPWGCRDNGTRT